MNLFNLLISPANAQSAGSIAGFDIMSLAPLVLIFVVFYFFLIRPQQKKAQQHKELLNALRRGDKIITNGGLIGTVVKVISDQELQVEIADDVRVRVARAMVAEVISKTAPMPEEPEAAPAKTKSAKVLPLKKAPAKPMAKKPASKKAKSKAK